MFELAETLYSFVLNLYNAVNVPIVGNVGYLDIVIGFIIIAFCISVFWKGVRV